MPDLSVTLSWCVDDLKDPGSDELLDRVGFEDELVVPVDWLADVAGALLPATRAEQLDEHAVAWGLTTLQQLPVRVDALPDSGARLFATAWRHEIGVRAAAYVLLADRLGLPLATLDPDVARAAGELRVSLVLPPPERSFVWLDQSAD